MNDANKELIFYANRELTFCMSRHSRLMIFLDLLQPILLATPVTAYANDGIRAEAASS